MVTLHANVEHQLPPKAKRSGAFGGQLHAVVRILLTVLSHE